MSEDPIATFVRLRRHAADLTQVELAERAGVGLRFVRELERGKATVRRDKVNQVLALFGHVLGPLPVDRATLLGRNDAEEPDAR